MQMCFFFNRLLDMYTLTHRFVINICVQPAGTITAWCHTLSSTHSVNKEHVTFFSPFICDDTYRPSAHLCAHHQNVKLK